MAYVLTQYLRVRFDFRRSRRLYSEALPAGEAVPPAAGTGCSAGMSRSTSGGVGISRSTSLCSACDMHRTISLQSVSSARSRAGSGAECSAEPGVGMARGAEGSGEPRVGMALKIDLRLLSYLLAYVICQLPALPSFVLDGLTGFDLDSCRGACEWPRTSQTTFWEGLRDTTQPLQGLLNAVVFAHHVAGAWQCCETKSAALPSLRPSVGVDPEPLVAGGELSFDVEANSGASVSHENGELPKHDRVSVDGADYQAPVAETSSARINSNAVT